MRWSNVHDEIVGAAVEGIEVELTQPSPSLVVPFNYSPTHSQQYHSLPSIFVSP